MKRIIKMQLKNFTKQTSLQGNAFEATKSNTSKIYYDAKQEAEWFQSIDDRLSRIKQIPIPKNPEEMGTNKNILAYDRPDIILVMDGEPVLVLERSEEVPSGHNVGQRFARLLAAAEANVPCIYIFPFKQYLRKDVK